MLESSEYVKYIAERVATYLDEGARKETADDGRSPKPRRESWTVRWFGVVAIGIGLWRSERRRRRGRTLTEEGAVRSAI